MFFLLKRFRASAWNSKDVSIGGTNLTSINSANIVCETKLSDTLKYYQKCLGQLAATLSDEKRLLLKKSQNNSYCLIIISWMFGIIWVQHKKEKFLDK